MEALVNGGVVYIKEVVRIRGLEDELAYLNNNHGYVTVH
jgi:hypothetical protein